MYWHRGVLETMTLESEPSKFEASSSSLDYGQNGFDGEDTAMLNLEDDQEETDDTRVHSEPLEIEAGEPADLRKQ